jgi:hypothetical protein
MVFMKLKYLVTGTGRCGTLNMAHNLTKAGASCGHESIFDVKGIDTAKKRLNGEIKIHASDISTNFGNKEIWFDPLLIQADASYMAAPFLKDEVLEGTAIIHLTRDPLKVISSFIKNLGYFETLNTDWEKFMCNNVPSIANYGTAIERACEYYIKWNQMILEHAAFKHNIEDDINVLLEELRLPRLAILSDEKNKWNKRDKNFSIEEIPKKFRDDIFRF